MKISIHFFILLSATISLATVASDKERPETPDTITCSKTACNKKTMVTYRSVKRGIQVSHMLGASFYAGTQCATTEQNSNTPAPVTPLKDPKTTFWELQNLCTEQKKSKEVITEQPSLEKKSSTTTCSLL